MTKHLLDVTAEIAALVVNGVKILDVDEIPDAVTLRAGEALMYPEPVDFVSGVAISNDTQGPENSRLKTFNYTLTYTVCCAPLGSGRGIKDNYPNLGTKAQAILYALAQHEFTGGVMGVDVSGISGFGTVPDPSYSGGENNNGLFYGFRLTLAVKEFMEV